MLGVRLRFQLLKNQWLLIAVSLVVLFCVKRSTAVPAKRDFCDCCRNRAFSLYGRKSKAFCQRALHCIVSNMKRISIKEHQNIEVAPILEKFLRTPMFTIFDLV